MQVWVQRRRGLAETRDTARRIHCESRPSRASLGPAVCPLWICGGCGRLRGVGGEKMNVIDVIVNNKDVWTFYGT